VVVAVAAAAAAAAVVQAIKYSYPNRIHRDHTHAWSIL